MATLFLTFTLFLLASPANCDSSLTVDEQAVPASPIAPLSVPEAIPEAPPQEDQGAVEEEVTRPKPVVKEAVSKRITAEDQEVFRHWLAKLCREEPSELVEATRISIDRHGKRVITKPGNRGGSLQIMLENYADLVKSGKHPESILRLRKALKKEFYELREASILDGKPGSEHLARKLLTNIKSSTSCFTRGTSVKPYVKPKEKPQKKK